MPNTMTAPIPVVDLFAGPGGLGEGFSSFIDDSENTPFVVVLSIEKDTHACRTLEMRSLFRLLDREEDSANYFRHLRGELTRHELFRLHDAHAQRARATCWQLELGTADLSYSQVQDRIRQAVGGTGMWVLIGGPPCQAYSVIGRARVRNAGRERYESDGRHFLYREYLRIVADHAPAVFLMENVKGLLSTEISGLRIFHRMLEDLQAPREAISSAGADTDRLRYEILSLCSTRPAVSLRANDYVVKAESFGVPQKRHRVFLLGVRSDLLPVDQSELCLLPRPGRVAVEDVISDLPEVRSGLSDSQADSSAAWKEALELTAGSDWFACEMADARVRDEITRTISYLRSADLSRGAEYVECRTDPVHMRAWYVDSRLHGVCNHSTRSHIIEDLHRYLYASCFARVNGHSPKLKEYPPALLPRHRNVACNSGRIVFSDRFRVQVEGSPSSTVTSHMSKDGHYYIHPDPRQCRSLTVREAARLQTFPDNYFFEGPRTSQYQQVGNAVPPLLAREIAGIVFRVLSARKVRDADLNSDYEIPDTCVGGDSLLIQGSYGSSY